MTENASQKEITILEPAKLIRKLVKSNLGYDPSLSKEEIEAFGVKALDKLDVKADCVIITVTHDEFKNKPLL